MTHIRSRASTRRRLDYAMSMVWTGLGLSGLSLSTMVLLLAYSSLANLFTNGSSVSITGTVAICAVSFAIGFVMSIVGFAIGVRAERTSLSGSETKRTLVA